MVCGQAEVLRSHDIELQPGYLDYQCHPKGCNNEIGKVEEKVKRLGAKKNQPCISKEQKEIWNNNIAKAENDLKNLQEQC